jgi:hypothetical protein
MQYSTTASTPVAQKVETAGDYGTFKAGEHPTQGMVSLVTEKEKRYLEFDRGFKTSKGSAPLSK